MELKKKKKKKRTQEVRARTRKWGAGKLTTKERTKQLSNRGNGTLIIHRLRRLLLLLLLLLLLFGRGGRGGRGQGLKVVLPHERRSGVLVRLARRGTGRLWRL